MVAEAPALRLDGVRSGYGESEVLHGIDLRVEPGEIHAVLGKNGMGKSTLLKTCIGLLPRRAGKVWCYGEDVTARLAYQIARRSVSYVPQELALFQDLSVEDNLRLGMHRQSHFRERLAEVARLFPFLPERLRQRAGTLSGGEQKMVLIARALLPQPRLMLIDEVSEGVQPFVLETIRRALTEAREKRRVAILLIEQNVDFALSIADRYTILKLGEIVDTGQVHEQGVRAAVEEHLTI